MSVSNLGNNAIAAAGQNHSESAQPLSSSQTPVSISPNEDSAKAKIAAAPGKKSTDSSIKAFAKTAFFMGVGVIATAAALITLPTTLIGGTLWIIGAINTPGSNLDDRPQTNTPAQIARYAGAAIALPATIAMLSFSAAAEK